MNLKFGVTALALSLLINACSQSQVPESGPQAPEEEPMPTETVEPSEKEIPTQASETSIRLPDMKLKYDIEGEFHEEHASLQFSDEQGFSVYVLEGYLLEAEEPGKDMIIGQDAEVRIEVLEEKYSMEERFNIVEQRAKAAGGEYFHNETAGLEGILDHSIWFKVYTDDMATSIISVMIDEQPVIFTIFTPREKEVLEPILAMLQTLMVNHDVPDGVTK